MKTIIYTIILSFACLAVNAQDPKLPSDLALIVLQSEKKIKSARLWKIDARKVEYEWNGSLHDVELDQIKVIKLKNEIVTFGINGEIQIRPYDVIISGSDTIKCIVTRLNSGNLYFYKQQGFQKADYISQHMVDHYYVHREDLVFDTFQSEYVSLTAPESSDGYVPDTTNNQVRIYSESEGIPETHTVDNTYTVNPQSAGRVVGQVIIGTTLGVVGILAGAIGGGVVLGLVGFIGGPVGAGIGAAVGAGLGAVAGFGLGTGLGVSTIGNKKYVKGKFGKAVGGAYLGLLGSIVVAVVAGGTGIGIVLIAIAPAVGSAIAFNKSRKVAEALLAEKAIGNQINSESL